MKLAEAMTVEKQIKEFIFEQCTKFDANTFLFHDFGLFPTRMRSVLVPLLHKLLYRSTKRGVSYLMPERM